MGGGSLKWGPPLVKRDLDYRFLPPHAYKFFTISLPFKWVSSSEWGCVFVKNDVKWVCDSEGVVIFDENDLSFLASCHF